MRRSRVIASVESPEQPPADGALDAEKIHAAPVSAAIPTRPRLAKVVGHLTVTNIVIFLAGFVTAPLLARALGPTGRGLFAAIIVPLTLIPAVASLALGAYASREVARGRPAGIVAGSIGGVSLVIGLIGASLAVPLADFFAHGQPTVHTFLLIGFLLMPVSLVGGILFSMLSGLELWRHLILTKLAPTVIMLLGVAGLYAVDELTVSTAAGLTLAGGLVSIVPSLQVLRNGGPIRFIGSVVREGLVFGSKTWAGSIAFIANQRLDQLLMIGLVAPSELGLYAVSVTIASVPTLLTGALGPPLITRIARGDHHLAGQALRVTLAGMAALNLTIAALLPWAVPFLYGEGFGGVVEITLVLLVAAIPLGGVAVLGAALIAEGSPGVPSLGEGAAIIVTVPGLLLLLPQFGAIGAAVASLAAYSVSFVIQLLVARRRFGGKLTDFLLVKRSDVAWALALLPASTAKPV